ncbi:MAG TPA: isoprenylcysteine carboxylmethyltransferase family protein [Anaerolineales bacterium]
MTALKTILFFLLVPGLCLGVVPLLIIPTNAPLFDPGFWRWAAVPLWLAGWTVLVWSCWSFAIHGRGTPNPLDPPEKLVVTGLYRYVRNPIYIAATAILVGWTFWSPSLPILFMPVICFAVSYLFVIFYEEPHLRKTFCAAYEEYCQFVPRWIPRFKRR